MAFQINLEQLYREAFGLNRPIYVVQANDQRTNIGSLTKQKTAGEYDPQLTIITLPANETEKSILGTPVLSPVTFEAGRYKQRFADGRITTVEYAELLLPPTTLVEVNLKKVIVKTPLVGGQGTFKEYISFDDYDVKIRGIYVGTTPDEVFDFIRRLMAIWTVPKEVGVLCDYLGILDIEALVIENINPQKLEGRPNMLPFEITCISDKPLQLNFLGS